METTITFVREHKVIVIESGLRHREIDIGVCTNSATTLECILELARKEWCTPKILHEFIACLDVACQEMHGTSAVETFCPGGIDRTVRW